jgi:hypothetical protein
MINYVPGADRCSGSKRRSGAFSSESPNLCLETAEIPYRAETCMTGQDDASLLGLLDITSSQLASDLSKRCRIQSSPGELRLRNDVREVMSRLDREQLALNSTSIKSSSSISIVPTPDPMCILIEFSPAPGVDAALSRFSYQVSRHYPHQRPIVRCIFFTTGSSPLITRSSILPSSDPARSSIPRQSLPVMTALASVIDPHDGLITHEALTSKWSGICSLVTAVEALVSVRQMCADAMAGIGSAT